MRAISAIVGLLLASTSAVAPGDTIDDSVIVFRYRVEDATGKPAHVNKFSCEMVYYPPREGLSPISEPCADFDPGPNAERVGAGTLIFPLPRTFPHGSVLQRAFLRAHYGRLVSAPAVVTELFYARRQRELKFVFYRRKGRPPVITHAASASVMAPRDGRRLADVRLEVGLRDPEGEPLWIDWAMGRPDEAGRASTRSSMGFGDHYGNVIACDPPGNCVVSYLRVKITPDQAPGTMRERTGAPPLYDHFPRIKQRRTP